MLETFIRKNKFIQHFHENEKRESFEKRASLRFGGITGDFHVEGRFCLFNDCGVSCLLSSLPAHILLPSFLLSSAFEKAAE